MFSRLKDLLFSRNSSTFSTDEHLYEMGGKNSSMAFGPQNGNKPLFNNRRLSDVRFLVDGQTLYGHKQVLALGSPVFEGMFFGALKEQREVIEITDLTVVGFKNALRYIYGFKIDFKLSELYESYMAADKYLLHDFHKAFSNYVISRLGSSDNCLIYEQLVAIGDMEAKLLALVQTVVMESSKEVFASKHFTEIYEETLISLLSLKQLRIPEFNLLLAVSKWVDCEVRRQGLRVNGENRQRVFEPIKGYILFSALAPDVMVNCEEVAQLLTHEELDSLLLHRPVKFELKTTRKADSESYSRTMHFSVNRAVSIETIHTIYSRSAANLSLKFGDSTGDLYQASESWLANGYWSFSFKPAFSMNPGHLYTLRITGDEQLVREDLLYKWPKLGTHNRSITFNAGPNPVYPHYSGRHFLQRISLID